MPKKAVHAKPCRVVSVCTWVYVLTSVSYVSHGVFKGPNDGVQHQFELRRRDGQKRREAVRVHRLQQVEEVCSVLWELFEVLDKKKCKKNRKG